MFTVFGFDVAFLNKECIYIWCPENPPNSSAEFLRSNPPVNSPRANLPPSSPQFFIRKREHQKVFYLKNRVFDFYSIIVQRICKKPKKIFLRGVNIWGGGGLRQGDFHFLFDGS